MWGDNDVLVEAEDLARIKEEVPNIVMNFKVSFAQCECSLFFGISFMVIKEGALAIFRKN